MSLTNSRTDRTEREKDQATCLPITADQVSWLKGTIRDIPDFPKPGIVFKDLTTLLRDPEAFLFVIDCLAEKFRPLKASYVAGIEARGFILATAVAYKLGIGFIPIRKPGKLPYKVERVSYDLEYGQDSLEIHVDAVEKDGKVLLVDDLLATGGTAAAGIKLLEKIGASVVGVGFVVELAFLSGREKLPNGMDAFSIIKYD